MSTFDPWADDEIEQDSDASTANTVINAEVTGAGFSSNSDSEEDLHSFIESEPQQITEKAIDDRATVIASENNEATSSTHPSTSIASPGDLQDVITDYLNGVLNEQGASEEKLLHQFDVKLLRAENAYQVADSENETFLFQVSINEGRNVNLLTTTFSNGKLIQLEILGSEFTGIPSTRSPFHGLYGHVLKELSMGEVYKLHGRSIILATNHPYPVSITEDTLEFTMLERLEIRHLP